MVEATGSLNQVIPPSVVETSFGPEELTAHPRSGVENSIPENSPESPVFHKGGTLYNLHAARNPIRKEESVILVEGYFDVQRLVLAGQENVVAPLGTALTLNYTSPLFLAMLVAGLAVRSRGGGIDWPLMGTVAIGFAGVILVLQPNFAPSQAIGAGAGLFSGVLSALAYWQVKELSERGEPEWRIVFYFSLTGTALGLLGILPFGFTRHTASGALLLVLIGVSTLLAQLAMTRAYGRGRTLTAANLQFSAVVFASVLGVVMFDDRIPLIGWTGIAVIIASGIASTALTARRRTEPATSLRTRQPELNK